MRKSAAMKTTEAYFKGMEAEFGESLSEWEFGWFAAQFGVALRELLTINERNGWRDFMKGTLQTEIQARDFAAWKKATA
jgi:hypothetical protein